MDNFEKNSRHVSRWKRYAWILAVILTLIASASIVWNVTQVRHNILESARIQARVAHGKDVIYRRWNTEQGGVYVPMSDMTQPNPYLSDLPERDITTSAGQELTLMNPAYMTRQAHKLEEDASGVQGHITSLNPIRPENAPDAWESEALKSFEHGESEVSSVAVLKGQKYMRLMRPLITEKGCLKCHAIQGYKEGDVRGGISISVPIGEELGHARLQSIILGGGQFLMWLVVMTMIALGTQRLTQIEGKRLQGEKQIQKDLKEKEILLKEIHHRVKNNLQVIHSLIGLQSSSIKDKEVAAVLKETQNRITSIAKIHEELYQSKDFTNINFKEYIENLARSLYATYNISPDSIKLDIKIENSSVGIDNVIPCGLVVNELVSNALKYAFPPSYQGKGRIEIHFRLVNGKVNELVIKDNGIGIPKELDIQKVESLGMLLVHMLVENQLEGELSLDRTEGTKFTIRFKS